MSTEQDKYKNSRRRLKDENAVKKQTKIAKEFGVPVIEPHKFAKRRLGFLNLLQTHYLLLAR